MESKDRKKYRVWRAVVRFFDRSLVIRCQHNTDNLQDVRDYYHRIYKSKQPITLYYTEF